MDFDRDKVDEMTLALLYLVSSDRKDIPGARAWKGFDISTLQRLHKKGWVEEPKLKDMSLNITEEGFEKSRELFNRYFGKKEK